MTKRFVMIVGGKSAEELSAVGPQDLKDYLLPEKLNVRARDVVQCLFVDTAQNAFHEDNIYGDGAAELATLANFVRRVQGVVDGDAPSETILSCPFCGSTDVEIARTNPNACWVECAGCGAKADSAPTREEAIANWNKTVPRVSATVIDDGDADYWNTVAWIEARRDGQE